MLNIAVCDDSRTDVEMLESAFDKLAQYQFSYEVYFTAKELLKHVIDYGEMYHLYIFDIEMPEMNGLQLQKRNPENRCQSIVCIPDWIYSVCYGCF